MSDYLPTPQSVIGAYAGALGQLWDLSVEWWRVVAEQGYTEDTDLTRFSRKVWLPHRPGGYDVESTSHPPQYSARIGGKVSVTVDETAARTGPKFDELTLNVQAPPGVRAIFVHFTARADPKDKQVRMINLEG
jgi:hypothetical protein